MTSDFVGPRGEDSKQFWSTYQPGFRHAGAAVGTKEFFDQVTAGRYNLEPHIPEIARFERWGGCDVLEAGCGIGTDGARFAATGARYVGLDFSPVGLGLARRRFDMGRLPGRFVAGSVTKLPFADETFDLVFSHGVIHHVVDTSTALGEFLRVLRPGGTLLVMVYHRSSINYYLNIMVVRRVLAGLMLLPMATTMASRMTGEPRQVIEGHRALLTTHGFGYIRNRDLFLAHNTDGTGNPLSKVYSRRELQEILPRGFCDVVSHVRYLNIRLYPGGNRLSRTRVAERLGRRYGWHLYAEATKERRHIP